MRMGSWQDDPEAQVPLQVQPTGPVTGKKPDKGPLTQFRQWLKSWGDKLGTSGGIYDPSSTNEEMELTQAYGPNIEWLDVTEDFDLPTQIANIAAVTDTPTGTGARGTKSALLSSERLFKSGRVYAPKLRLSPNIAILKRSAVTNDTGTKFKFISKFGNQVRYKSWLGTIIISWSSSTRAAGLSVAPANIAHFIVTDFPDPSNIQNGTLTGGFSSVVYRVEAGTAASVYFIRAVNVSGTTSANIMQNGLQLPRNYEVMLNIDDPALSATNYIDASMFFEVR